MRNIATFLFCCILSVGCSRVVSPREVMDFNYGWSFNLGDVTGASAPDFDDSAWRSLDHLTIIATFLGEILTRRH